MEVLPDRFSRSGNQLCFCQYRAMSSRVHTCVCWNFLRTWGRIGCEGKASVNIPFQSIVSASVSKALASGVGDTNVGHLLYSVANRSMLGYPLMSKTW